jgi:dTDP-4-amino-4,6-dideoxygalactose transaminase
MNVPFLDLKAQYASIKDEVNEAIQEVLDSSAFAGGPFVEKFEKEWASYCGVPHAVGVGNGTEALWLVLLAMGIGQGDEVITVPNSFLATAEAISLAGATPVFVDIDQQTYTMDPALLEAAITPRTRAVVPVHIFGQTADMDPIIEIARQRSLFVLEDACQAHGAEYKGKRAGTIGDAGCFSFYPGKNLGAYGEAGAIVTSDRRLAETVRMLRDHGQRAKYFHSIVGCNARMDGIQGAVLSVKLRHLDEWNEARRKAARMYRTLLVHSEEGMLPAEAEYARHIYHIFAIRIPERDRLLKDLERSGVHCGIHYPVPIHLQEAYAHLGLGRGSFPVAEQCAAEFLSLPMYAELDDKMIMFVCDRLRESRMDAAEVPAALPSR